MSVTSQQQLTLNVNLRDGYRFDSFYVKSDSLNFETVSILRAFVESTAQQQNILWGEPHVGKTHLLQACCAKEAEVQHTVSYIPLKIFAASGVDVLTGLSQSQ